MADNIELPSIAVQPTRQQRAGYAAGHEVQRRAAVTSSFEDDRLAKSLKRLDKLLAADTPPRTDVPRGYYVNILV